jgi:hypothetical protein
MDNGDSVGCVEGKLVGWELGVGVEFEETKGITANKKQEIIKKMTPFHSL